MNERRPGAVVQLPGMDRPRHIRGLRIAASTLVLVACIPFVAFWVRSYKTCDLIGRRPLSRQNVLLMSLNGRVHFFGQFDVSGRGGTKWVSFSGKHSTMVNGVFMSEKGSFRVQPGTRYLVATHWLLVSLIAPLAIIPWISWSRRFSIRTLLIAATLIALVLGSLLAAVTNT